MRGFHQIANVSFNVNLMRNFRQTAKHTLRYILKPIHWMGANFTEHYIHTTCKHLAGKLYLMARIHQHTCHALLNFIR